MKRIAYGFCVAIAAVLLTLLAIVTLPFFVVCGVVEWSMAQNVARI